MRRYIRFVLISLAAAVFASCGLDEGDHVPSPELGAYIEGDVDNSNVLSVEYTGGVSKFGVYASQPYEAQIISGTEWVRIGVSDKDIAARTLALNGDGTIYASVDRNDGLKRMALITLTAENRIDTVFVKQKGHKSGEIELSSRAMNVGSQGGQFSVLLKSSIEFELLKKLVYGKDIFDQVDWVSNITCVNNMLKFDVEPNLSTEQARKATIRFSYTDGWGDTVMAEISITQEMQTNQEQKITTFAELRQGQEREIDENLFIEGYIVSDVASGNAAPNIPITNQRIDYTGTQRTAYIESLDGQYGLMLEFKTVEDNILSRYDKVRINLNGCYFCKEGSEVPSDNDPLRFYVNDVAASNIISIESGSSASIPSKVKYFSELTDEDIYTYVTLKDCEFPVKKGPLTPLNEGYTGGGVATIFTANRISSYPLLVRDSYGNSFYTITNTTCVYRRNAQQLPYGSGTISGVIVHEACDRFEWDTVKEAELAAAGYSVDQIYNLGHIGRYQIRHQSLDDIAFSREKSEALTTMICEFAYFNNNREDCLKNADDNGVLYYPSVDSHTAKFMNVNSSTAKYPTAQSAWYFLGDSNCNDPAGSGVVDANGTKVDGYQLFIEDNANSGDRGLIEAKYGCAWGSDQWKDTKNCWKAELSTTGLSGTAPSVQFAVLNKTIGAPRYWKVQWSADDSSWQDAGTYTVPDVTSWDNTCYWQLCGFKHVNCELPATVLGQSKLYIRLIPESAAAGQTSTYDKGTSANGKWNCIAYFAVRYTPN